MLLLLPVAEKQIGERATIYSKSKCFSSEAAFVCPHSSTVVCAAMRGVCDGYLCLWAIQTVVDVWVHGVFTLFSTILLDDMLYYQCESL